jgi:hypothetical protein
VNEYIVEAKSRQRRFLVRRNGIFASLDALYRVRDYYDYFQLFTLFRQFSVYFRIRIGAPCATPTGPHPIFAHSGAMPADKVFRNDNGPATDQTKEDILAPTMSNIHHPGPSDPKRIEEEIIQLVAEKNALSVRIRRLNQQKKEYHHRSAQLDRETRRQKKAAAVRPKLPKIPTHPPVYRRTADTQQRRCDALWQVWVTEG